MGRRPTRSDSIPRFRVRKQKSGKVHYYYDHGGKPRRETPLGSDYGLAVKKWAELEHEGVERVAQAITFRYVADQYRKDVVPTKAPRTQRDNMVELGKLIEFFCDPDGPLDAIQPQHVRQYLTWRSSAKVRANREKALLSHIWNFSRDKGYTSLPNPCAGIKGNKESGRKDVYVHDEAFNAVWKQATAALRDAMDLAYLAGQRPADTLRMDETHIREGALEVAQGKTKKKLRIAIEGEFGKVVERIKARKRTLPIYSTRLVVDDRGQPLSLGRLEDHFVRARTAAGIDACSFQFRDLRAKAGTDKNDRTGSMQDTQKQLGHASVVMTEHYIRDRRGAKVTPTK